MDTQRITTRPLDFGRSAVALPPTAVGLICLPGSQRQVWWTGRVAIGLRYEKPRPPSPAAESGRWIQRLMVESA